MKCMNMNKYHSLNHVNYDDLKVTKRTQSVPVSGPDTLLKLTCNKLTSCRISLTKEAVLTLPSHLATALLKAAIRERARCPAVITTILSHWPQHTLCFQEILEEDQKDIFEEEFGFDLIVFLGITSRTPSCKIKCVDLRGFKLNWTFTRHIIQMWPILSLKKKQRSVNRLTNIVLKKAGLKKDSPLSRDVIPQLIADSLNHEMITQPRFGIHLPRGEELIVLLDKVKFSFQNTFYMDYLITNCLRDITPLKVIPSVVIIDCELGNNDNFIDSLAPFIVFRGHATDNLGGLCLENLEDSLFFATSPSIQRFENLTSLALLNCNICLQEGRTRRRTKPRHQVTELLSSLKYLKRLDLSHNSFVGCLSEILTSCQQPLDFLSLHDCDLSNSDMDALAQSKHAKSLRELNISRICGLFLDDSFAVSTEKLVESLQYFPNLVVLWIASNQITDQHVEVLCKGIKNSLQKLKFLHQPSNLLTPDGALRVVQACCHVTSMQFVHVGFTLNILELALQIMEQGPDIFNREVAETLRRAKRTDLVVNVSNVS